MWALGVLEPPGGLPYAQLIVEVGAEVHASLVEAAGESGFVPITGEFPEADAAVEVVDGLVERLLLAGGRCGWEPGERAEVTPGWLAAAERRGTVLINLVPPGTWSRSLLDLEPEERRAAFALALDRARVGDGVLHGLAALVNNGAVNDVGADTS
jgi:hypothetical protein